MPRFRLLWKKGNARRYYVEGTGIEVQIGKYRGPDSFDKHMGTKSSWHNKWYVEALNHGKAKLFSSQVQANNYLKKLMNRLFMTRQLNKRRVRKTKRRSAVSYV